MNDPFKNIYSIKVSVITHLDGTVVATDESTGDKSLCCPICHEPYWVIGPKAGTPFCNCKDRK